MNPTLDPRDAEVLTLVGQIDHRGIVVLLALARCFPEPVKLARLALMTKSASDIRKVLRPILDNCEICGYATRTGSGAFESWHLTDIGQQTVLNLVASLAATTDRLPSRSRPALPTTLRLPGFEEESPPLMSAGENFSAARSYSSDQIDQSSDQIDLIEEDTAEKISARRAWCANRSITGDKRARIVNDAWCTPERLEAWLQHWTTTGCTANGEPFRSKYGPLNYAIACCLQINKDGSRNEPPYPSDIIESLPAVEPAAEKISRPFPDIQPGHLAIWQSALGELQMEVTRASFQTYLRPSRLYSVEADHWTIAAPNHVVEHWLRDRLHSTIQRILNGILGKKVIVEYILVEMETP